MVIWRCYHCLDEIGKVLEDDMELNSSLSGVLCCFCWLYVLCIFVAPSGVHI